MIVCARCGFSDGNESHIDFHHKVPKSIGGTDLDGRVYLCKKCHDIWHNMLPKFIWKWVPDDKKNGAKAEIRRMCDWWVGKK